MAVETTLFYAFSCLSIIFSLIVIISKNPIHSILSLVLVFFNAAGLILILGAEFLALLFLIVYVGAVAVLFLFVIMMLNIKIASVQTSIFRHGPFILFLALIVWFGINSVLSLNDLVLNIDNTYIGLYYQDLCLNPNNLWSDLIVHQSNVVVLGNVLYTDYFYFFIVSGIILLVSMLGAISLTLHRRNDVRKQFIYKQLQRNFDNSIIWKN